MGPDALCPPKELSAAASTWADFPIFIGLHQVSSLHLPLADVMDAVTGVLQRPTPLTPLYAEDYVTTEDNDNHEQQAQTWSDHLAHFASGLTL